MILITEREMKRRELILRLQCRITDVIGEFVTDGPDSISLIEVAFCLNEAVSQNLKGLLREEWKDEPRGQL